MHPRRIRRVGIPSGVAARGRPSSIRNGSGRRHRKHSVSRRISRARGLDGRTPGMFAARLENHWKSDGKRAQGSLARLENIIFGSSTFRKKSRYEKTKTGLFADDWEIPFEAITDLTWLGAGAQGAVFSGKLRGETVAVKKVQEQKETDIKNLRKLNHPNVVKFKLVLTFFFLFIRTKIIRSRHLNVFLLFNFQRRLHSGTFLLDNNGILSGGYPLQPSQIRGASSSEKTH